MLQVEIFDEEHEEDLQSKMNVFLKDLEESQVIDIKYSVSSMIDTVGDQVYCFSALVLYRN
ncbi:sporulation protein Cse60 [Bacillus carboniphilus]|uniref:Sporulation protein Cse60 n=1 Tax=Bacillus carboniphilus TaxID=86663 RepID=A0ABY9JQS7_9BACI|nr:sporulation protein Cse60 [Bacillus carboniphilus]WLR41159.1 sporulation protein Cse60 [Bacillus carboniphilus]